MDSSEQAWITPTQLGRALGVKPGRLRDSLAKGQFAGSYQDHEGRWHIPARYLPTFKDVPLFEFESQ